MRQLFDVQFHLSYHAKIMSWGDVEQLPLPELELIVSMLNDAREKEEKAKSKDNIEQVIEQFKLTKRLREAGMIPEQKTTATQRKRLDKMRKIRERHPLGK